MLASSKFGFGLSVSAAKEMVVLKQHRNKIALNNLE